MAVVNVKLGPMASWLFPGRQPSGCPRPYRQASRASLARALPQLVSGAAGGVSMVRRGPSEWAGARAPTAADIERIGRQVLAELPALFRAHVRGVVIKVEDFPDEETEREMELESPYDLLGLYCGVPVGHGSGLAPPRQNVDMIFLYRAPLLHYWCETGEPLDESCATR